jgi:hypothetical protein
MPRLLVVVDFSRVHSLTSLIANVSHSRRLRFTEDLNLCLDMTIDNLLVAPDEHVKFQCTAKYLIWLHLGGLGANSVNSYKISRTRH